MRLGPSEGSKMNVILYSKDNRLLGRWQEILAQNYSRVVLCTAYELLLEQMQENKCIVLFHLNDSCNGEHELQELVSRYDIQERILVLVNCPDVNQGVNVLYSGAHGYASANLCGDKLQTAVDFVLNGEVWLDKEILHKLLNRKAIHTELPNPKVETEHFISKREKQIVDKVLLGKTNAQAAQELGITERTVKTHVSNIFRKTQTKSRIELINKFQNLG